MANDLDVSSKFTIDYSSLKTASADIYNQMQGVEKSFWNAANASDNFQNTSQGLAKRVESLSDKIALQKTKVNLLRNEYEKVAEKEGANSKGALTLEKSYISASKKAADMNKELNAYQKTLGKVAIEEGKTAKEAEAMGGKISAAGKKTSSAGSQLKDFAMSSVGQLTTVAGGAALVEKAIEKMAKLISDSAKWADDLTTLSRKVNINTQELQKMTYAANFVDVDVNTMASSMAKLTKNMGSARDGNKDLQSAFKDQLGIDIEVNGHLRDKNDIFSEAIDKLGKMTNATERDVLAQKIFGKSAAELNPLIALGGDALKKYGKEAQDMGVVVDRGSVAVLSRLQDEFDKTQAVADATGKHIAASMAPAAKALDNMWRSFLQTADPVNQLNSDMKNYYITQGMTVDEAQKMVDVAKLGQEAYYAMGLSTEEFNAKAKELAEYLEENGTPSNQKYTEALGYLADGYDLAALKSQKVAESQTAIDDAFANTQSLIQEYADKLESTTDRISDSAGGLFDGFPKKVKTSVKEMTKALKSQSEGLEEWSDDLNTLAKRGVDDGLIAQLREMGPKAAGQVHNLSTATDGALDEYVSAWRKKNAAATKAAEDELKPMKDKVDAALVAMEQSLKNNRSDLSKQAALIGGDIESKLTNRIDELKNKLKNLGSINVKVSYSQSGYPPHGTGGYFDTAHTAVVGDKPEWIVPTEKTARNISLLEGAAASLGYAVTNLNKQGGTVNNYSGPSSVVIPVSFGGKLIDTVTVNLSKSLADQARLTALAQGV
jgi:chromosome segregation ATPase